MSLSPEEEKKIFNFLRSQNCCLRCCFRFIGWRTPEDYEDRQRTVKLARKLEYIDSENDVVTEEPPCVACLGILQYKTEETVVQKIQKEVKEQNYDCETFTCALTVPVSVRLRERLLHTHCATELSLSNNAVYSLKIKLQSLKDVWKWVIIPKIEEAIEKQAELTLPSAFLIEVFLLYEHDEKECKALLSLCKGTGNIGGRYKRKNNDQKLSRKSMEVLMAEMSDEKFAKIFDPSAIKATTFVTVGNILCSHNSIFVGGRYNKLSRQLSQTPWFINGEKKMETSVQDLLCNHIAQTVKAQSIKFLSSGREDVDVRNIHSGRPFAVELVNPRMTKITQDLLSTLADQINRSSNQVQITSSLRVLSRLDLKRLKEGENIKTKFYRALCVCRSVSKNMLEVERLNNMKRVKIIQRTPVRVLHRRPLCPRARLIYEMRARWATPQELSRLLNTVSEDGSMFFVLDIKTQAGTYVKEFVHGDFGRTKPSLCELLNTEVDIVALDVTGINLDWP